MKEYSYDPHYKNYTSSSECFSSPIDEGQYLVSASATLIEPPEVLENQIQIFNIKTESWDIIEDLRGKYYSIFTGQLFYNENPFEAPENCTKIKPPIDYNQNNYRWNSETDLWEKINKIYEETESNVNKLTIQEKLNKLNISISELKDILGISSYSDDIKNLSNIFEVVNLPIEDKFKFLNLDKEELKKFIGFSEIINSTLIDKLKLINIDIEDLQNLLEVKKLLDIVKECKLEQNLILNKIQRLSNALENYFSSTKSPTDLQYLNLVNLYTNIILRPYEIIQTSEKFENDNLILDSSYIGICEDTGERKFGDGITVWNDLPSIPPNQRYRFSRTLEKWQTQNPIPGENIECYESDTGNLKVGNGFSTWDKLPYENA